jgi:hypothetical protein
MPGTLPLPAPMATLPEMLWFSSVSTLQCFQIHHGRLPAISFLLSLPNLRNRVMASRAICTMVTWNVTPCSFPSKLQETN